MSAEVAALELQRPKYQDERPDVELPEVGGGTVGLASLARASSAASEPDEAAPPLSPRAVEGEGGGLAFQPDSGRVELRCLWFRRWLTWGNGGVSGCVRTVR